MKKKIIVIGGGLAGCLLCNELADHADVTLLEVGSKDSIHYPNIGYDHKQLAAVPTFCYGGGGTTNLWHNGLIPIRQEDVCGQEFRDVLTDAHLFTDQAAAELFFTHEAYSVAYEKVTSEIRDMFSKIGNFPDGFDSLIYPKKYKRLTVESRVHSVYEVSKIGFEYVERRIRRLTCYSGSEHLSFDADVVIVAAGTMGTPRIVGDIITASGNQFDRLGSGFIDHPMGFVGKVRFNSEVAGLFNKLSMYDKGEYVARSAIRLKSDCGQYTCCAFLRPALTMDNSLAVYKYKSLLGASSGMTRIRNIFSWKLFHPDIIAEIFSHLFGCNIPSRTYNILFIGDQKRGDSRVYYDGDGVRVDWSVSPDELAIYRSLLKKLGGMLQGVAEQVNIETDITEEWLWSAAHHSGTIPLGATAEDLIDTDLKLQFCDNVFVCDGSVIQEHSYANTGLTIAQMAMRLARRVLDVSDK